MAIEKRFIFAFLFVFCAALLGGAVVFQYFVSVVPCPLCVLQRGVYFLIGFIALFGFLGWPKNMSSRVYGRIFLLFSLAGGSIAGYQVWLQYFSSAVIDPTKCIVPLGSFFDSVILAFGATGSCSLVDWTFFHLSLAGWSLLSFVFLASASIWLSVRKD